MEAKDIKKNTLPETNMFAPENRPSQKERRIQIMIFHLRELFSGRVCQKCLSTQN